jgi:hypothetical protein
MCLALSLRDEIWSLGNLWRHKVIHCKKRFVIFLSPSRMSLTILAVDGKIANIFLQCKNPLLHRAPLKQALTWAQSSLDLKKPSSQKLITQSWKWMLDSQYSAYQGPFPSTMSIRAGIQTFAFSQYAVFVQRSFVVYVDKYIALHSDRLHKENTRNIPIKIHQRKCHD